MQTNLDLAWLDAHYQAMPPVAALQLQPARLVGDALQLQAPLDANVNDKGCAFGGSLVSVMTLAGWGLVNLRLREAGLDADVFVADSQVRYLKPVFSELQAQATLDEGESWQVFINRLRTRSRAALGIMTAVKLPDGDTACSAQSRYVAIAKR